MRNKKLLINISFFIFLIILSIYRSPYIFFEGRFLYGDAFFFANALNNTWDYTMLLIYKEAGYINLFSNLSSLISAKLINIYYAPLFNTYFCFLLILLLFYILIFMNSDYFKTNIEKYTVSLVILVGPPFIFEIWLNNLNAQIYLAIITFFILFIKHKNKYLFFFVPFLLISGLSGVYSCLLTPLYLFKFIYKRNFTNMLKFGALGLATLTQIFIILNSKLTNSLSSGKLDFYISTNEFISFIYNVIIRTFFSGKFPNMIISSFDTINVHNNSIVIFSFTIFLMSIFLFIYSIRIITKFYKKDLNIYISLIYLFFISSFVVIVGGVNDVIAGRYAVIPGLSLILIVIKLSFEQQKKFLNYLSIFLISSAFITGFIDYRNEKHITYFDCIGCPNWREEVNAFKINESYELKVWPYTENKVIVLNKKLY